jgi:hypothetical protein
MRVTVTPIFIGWRRAKSGSDILIKREDESGKNTLEQTLLQQSPPNTDELPQ